MQITSWLKRAAFAVAAVVCAFGAAAEDFSVYAHKAYITFSGYAGESTLTNFPALVRIAEGVGGFSYADCAQASGGDVRFSLGNGVGLPSECVKWDATGTSEFWVRVPELTASTRIMMFWGNAKAPARVGAVWSEDYSGVWQMNDDGKVILDSGRKGVHGFATGDANGDAGVVGKARTFANSSYAYLGGFDHSPLEGLPLTMEVWFKMPAAQGGDRAVMSFHASHRGDMYTMGAHFFIGSDRKMHFGENNKQSNWDLNLVATSAASLNEWHHAFASQDADGKVIFCIDGVKQAEGTFTGQWYAPSNRNVFNLCRSGYGFKGGYFTGSLDEMRVSTVARSEDYAAAVYKNAAQNDQFLTIEAEPENTVSLTVDSVFRDRTGEDVRYVSTGDDQIFADGMAVESVPANARQIVTVHPVKRQYRLSVTADDGLAVTPSTEQWVDEGTMQTVSATATGTDRLFYAWEGNCPTTRVFTASIALPMDRPRTLKARAGKAWYVEKTGADEEGAGLSPATPMATPRYAVETIRADAAANTPAVLVLGDGSWKSDRPNGDQTPYLNLDCALVLRSRNGWQKTAIDCNKASHARGIFMNHFGACVDGLSVTNSATNITGVHGQGIGVSMGHVQNCLLGFSSLGYQCGNLELKQGWVRNTVFTGNRNQNCNTHAAPVSLFGGLIEDCAITNNTIFAGAVRLGASNSDVAYGGVVRNTLIAKNTTASATDSGAGIYCVRAGHLPNEDVSMYSVENCTIADNVAKTKGGGAYAAVNGLVLVNCAFGGNSVPTAANGMDLSGPIGVAGSVAREAPEGNGNVIGEETFADAAHGDYSLTLTSFSRDIGHPLAWHTELGAADLAGAARVQGKAVDAGAYEFTPPAKEPITASFLADVLAGFDTLAVAFTSTVKGSDDVDYEWDFGDGATSDEANPSHIYAHSGYYDVKLVVTDRTSGESFTNAIPDMIKIAASTVYVAEAGASVPAAPYDSPANAADNLAAAIGLAPSKVILGEGDIKLGGYVTLERATEIVGQGPEVTKVDFSASHLDLNKSGSVLRDLMVRNSRSESNIGSVNASAGTLVSNCVFAGTSSVGNREFNCAIRVNGATVRECVFRDLIHNYNNYSPCIEIVGGGSLVENCVVTNNSGRNGYGSSVSGIGIRVAGDYADAPVIRNCLIAGNRLTDTGSGSYAAGVALFGRARIENCTITGNAADKFRGAGLHVGASGVVVENCIVFGNTGKTNVVTWTSETTAVTNAVACQGDIYVADGKNPEFSHSCAPELTGVAGCVTADPKLNLGQKPKLPYYSILSGSPCRDAGVRLDWMDGATDLYGNPRRIGRPDIGCFECGDSGLIMFVR